MFSMEVKEQAACALWALAGQTKAQQKNIANRIGIQQLIEILLRDSERLQYVGQYSVGHCIQWMTECGDHCRVSGHDGAGQGRH
jgi:hypothetical protein